MHNVRFGEICELSYLRSAGPSLPRLVRELSERLQSLGAMTFRLNWDCDDIAVFDLPGHRIILATDESQNANVANRLLISVGPAADNQPADGIRLGHAALCRRITRAIERKNPADSRQTRSFAGLLTPERVDDLFFTHLLTSSKSGSFREFIAPPRSAPILEDQKLRAALASGEHWQLRKIMAMGLLINGLTWSMAAATPALALAVYGTNMIGTLMWASAAQLPR